jgi:nucleotide-binding universal stress UspA family protein
MSASDPDPIVVGVRDTSTAAVTWASRQAAIERRPLRLVHAREDEFAVLLASGAAAAAWCDTAASTPPVLDHALDVVEALRPEQRVSARAEIASASRLLAREATHASAIVVGNHGTSRIRHVVVGTIWQAILTRSSCPLVAVTGRPVWPDAPIVVGIDGRGRARAAVEFGYAQAARCDVPLHLYHVLRRWPRRRDAAIAGIIARHRLLEYTQRYPQVTSTVFYATGDPVRQLTDASADSQLLVIGSRARHAFSGLLTRSVSHALLRAAPCPIAVVPQRR